MGLEERDPRGHFIRDTFKTSNGYDLATYTWLPDCGVDAAKGCLFLFHGYAYHARFEFLDTNAQNERVEYAGSIPARFNELGLVVFAHDHPGHGLTSGQRAYWNSNDELRDAAIDFVEATVKSDKYKLAGKPRFVVGMSMGGAIAVQIARRKPELVTGYILLSPAVRTPEDMFGLYGRMLAAMSSVLNALVPQLRVLKLPPSSDPTIRDAVEKDDLVFTLPVCVRVGKEFLNMYKDIESNASSIRFPALLTMSGTKDVIVSSKGIQEFFEQVQSNDKKIKVFDHLGHEVIREHGCEDAREAAYSWVSERL